MVRTLQSTVWQSQSFPVNSEHLEQATWVDDYPEPCKLYAYARQYGISGCVHPGMDIGMPTGTPIRAKVSGVVAGIRNPGNPGWIEVTVGVANGDRHLYHHLNTATVTVGQHVVSGQLVGYSGNPDPGSGPSAAHLHFEHRVRDASTPSGWRIIDPEPLLTTGDGGNTEEPPSPAWSKGDQLRCFDGPVNIRASESTSAASKGSMPDEALVCCAGAPRFVNGHNWVRITYNGLTGYCVADYFLLYRADGCNVGTPPPSNILPIGVRGGVFDGERLDIVGHRSTSRPNTGMERVYDGNVYSYWHTTEPEGSTPTILWGYLDLGAVRAISGVRWYVKYPSGMHRFDVHISLDGTDWSPSGTFRSSTDAVWYGVAVNRNARYVRFQIHNPNGEPQIGYVREIEIWGNPGTTGGNSGVTWTHRVSGTSLNLRVSASPTAALVATMPIGTRLRLLSAQPVSAGGYEWWNVQAEGIGSGWCVDGFDPI